MDEKGRPWFTVRAAPAANPAFCRKGSDHPSAKVFPIDSSAAARVDVRSGDRQVHADRHLLPDPSPDLRRGRRQHAVAVERRRRSERGRLDQPPGAGGDRRPSASAGLVAVRARHQRQRQARRLGRAESSRRSAKDKRVAVGFYSVVRQSAGRHGLGPVAQPVRRAMPCASIRRRSSPKSTAPPLPGYGGRGADIDRNGVFWTSLASGHLGEFDRRKCKVLNGPTATGDSLSGRLDAAPHARPAASRA